MNALSSTPPTSQPDTPWPIRSIERPYLSAAQKRRAKRLADQRLDHEPALRGSWFEKEGVTVGWAPGPTVYLEDHRGIELATEDGAKSFEYRSLGLAGDGDFLLVSADRYMSFESYIRDVVGLGAPVVLELAKKDVLEKKRLGKACLNNPAALQSLINAPETHSGLNILPFLSTGDVWSLGREIARQSGHAVRVAGPPAQLSLRTNDKLWFADLVTDILGRRALPPTYEAYGLTKIAANISRLAQISEQIVIKVPASAGAMGNIVLPAPVFRAMRIAEIRSTLTERLAAIGWRNRFPLLIGVWEQGVVSSPSVQMWIPSQEQGPPLIEGVFVQAVSENDGGFVGAEPASLPRAIMDELLSEAQQVGFTLQLMGYFGRLSLDAVLLNVGAQPKIHWIEANARWGGVSIPMTIAHKIDTGMSDRKLLIVQRLLPKQGIINVRAMLDAIGSPQISLPTGNRKGMIILLPPETGYLLFAIIGMPRNEARNIADQVLRQVMTSGA